MPKDASSSSKPAQWPAFLQGGGTSGALVRSVDWAKTPLGPIESWPTSLNSIVGMLLHSRHPMFLWWGPELIQFYNDAYLPSFGEGKHPQAMGQPGRVTWQEIWPIIWPQIEAVMKHAQPSWNEDHLVPIWRNGHIEEVYWTYGYSPVFDEAGAVAGTLVVCTETTSRIIAQRRLQTLRALDERSALASEPAALLDSIAEVLTDAAADIPFALLYSGGQTPQLTAAAGIELELAARTLHPQFAARLAASGAEQLPIAALELPSARWPEPVSQALLVPIDDAAASGQPGGCVVFGLSPRLPFDAAYRDHLLHVVEHIATARARIEASCRRAAAIDERNKLLDELEAASRAKDEFLAMLGHELRNPLSPIVSALRMMKAHGDGKTAKEQQVIERQVNHLVRLLDDLLDVSKIMRGKVVLKRETGELHDVIMRAVEIASVLFEERRHQLQLDVPKQGLLWEGDPIRLAQVVSNLLTNAARYTNVGGQIRLAAWKEAEQIAISVKDNGIGIAADMLPRVFELFVQGKRSSDRAEGGLGLGLALVDNLVALHGGTVHANSAGIGRGSEFVIRLPAATHGAAPAAASAVHQPAAALDLDHHKRVLLVDDNTDAAELLADVLRHAGHEVTVANDPWLALNAVDGCMPEVAVLDIGLPVMDGYELASRLRETPAGANCRLIALTGYGQDHDRRRSHEAGFHHHLVKPVDLNVLLSLVAEGAAAS